MSKAMKIQTSGKRMKPMYLAAGALIVLALGTTRAHAQIQNGNFTEIGQNGNLVLLHVPGATGGTESAAKYWGQFTVVPNSAIVTAVEPLDQSTNQLHVITDAGHWQPAAMGNGFGQSFSSLPCAKASFRVKVESGQVTGSLVKTTGPFANLPIFQPMGGWKHYVEVVQDPVNALYFETLTDGSGANYRVADVQVTAFSTCPPNLQLRDLSQYLAYDPFWRIRDPGGPYERMRVTNTSRQMLTGPFQVMLEDMTPGRSLVNPGGNYLGTSFVTLNARTLAPGEYEDITLQFDASDLEVPDFRAHMVSADF